MRRSTISLALATTLFALSACHDSPTVCPDVLPATNISAEIRDPVTGAPLAANSRALLFEDDLVTPGGQPVDTLRMVRGIADTTSEAFKYSAFAQAGRYHVRIERAGYVTWSAPIHLESMGCSVTGASLEARLVHS